MIRIIIYLGLALIVLILSFCKHDTVVNDFKVDEKVDSIYPHTGLQEEVILHNNKVLAMGGQKNNSPCYTWLYFDLDEKLIMRAEYDDSCNVETKVYYGENSNEITQLVFNQQNIILNYNYENIESENNKTIVKYDVEYNCLGCHKLSGKYESIPSFNKLKQKYSSLEFAQHYSMTHDTLLYSEDRLELIYEMVSIYGWK